MKPIEFSPALEQTRRAVLALEQLLRRGHPLVVAYSGGKDSTTALSLVLTAARQLKAAGLPVPPLVVTTADTTIENPKMSALVYRELEKVRASGRRHGLAIRAEVATPALNDTWQVSVLSGRKVPTFANSSSRDCTISWKVTPMRRLRKRLLAELAAEAASSGAGPGVPDFKPANPALALEPEANHPEAFFQGSLFEDDPGVSGPERPERPERPAPSEPADATYPPAGVPITIIGTRFEESAHRSTAMTQRGESDISPWEKDGEFFLSPIANWGSDDVWAYLGEMRASPSTGFTDAKDIFELYAEGGGTSCAVVSDMATEGLKKSRACGARFGCSLCTAVGRDKSLEHMLESDPENDWLRGLNRIQRFLVDTRYDFNRRSWLGRALDEKGFFAVEPHTYSPPMLAELLRYCLTVDADEAELAARLRLEGPRFRLISPQALIAIDALWSLHAIQDRPFHAIALWHEVYVQKKRFYPPELAAPVPATPFPATRYIHVGETWDQTETGRYEGLRDVAMDLVSVDRPSPNRTLSNGREVLQFEESQFFEVDEESAALFFDWEAERVLARYHADGVSASNRAFFYYLEMGIVSTSSRHASALDAVMRRASWKRRVGLAGDVPKEVVLSRSLSQAERDAFEPPAPIAEEELPLRMRLCHPAFV